MGTNQPAVGWTDGRTRRARLFSGLLVGCLVASLWATFQPWFAWATPGLVPSCDPAPVGSPTIAVRAADGTVVTGIAARGCITGAQTVAAPAGPTGAPAGVASAATTLSGQFDRGGPDALAGLPRTAALLVAMLGLAAVGVSTRKGYLAVIAVFVLQISHQDLAALRGLYLSGVGSTLTSAQPGLTLFTWALLAGTVLAGLAAVFVIRVNYTQRVADRAKAREAGEPEPAEPLDPITTYVGRKLGKVKAVADDTAHQPVHA